MWWNCSRETNQISQELPTKSVLTSRYQEEVAGGWCHEQLKIFMIRLVWERNECFLKANSLHFNSRQFKFRLKFILFLQHKTLTTLTFTRRVVGQLMIHELNITHESSWIVKLFELFKNIVVENVEGTKKKVKDHNTESKQHGSTGCNLWEGN